MSSHFRPIDDWEIGIALKQPKMKGKRLSDISKSSVGDKVNSFFFLRFYDSDCLVCIPKDVDESKMKESAVVCELAVEDKCSRINDLVTRTSWKVSGKQFYIGSLIVGIGAVDQIQPGPLTFL